METTGNIPGVSVSHLYPVVGRHGQPDYEQNTKFCIVMANVTYYRFENDLLGIAAVVYATDDLEVYVRLSDVVDASGRGTYLNKLAKESCDVCRWRQASIRENTAGVRPTFIPAADAVKLAKAYARDPMREGVIDFFRAIGRTMNGLREGKLSACGLTGVVYLPGYLSFEYKVRKTKKYLNAQKQADERQETAAAEVAEVHDSAADVPEREAPVITISLPEVTPCTELTPKVVEELHTQLGYLVALRQEVQKRAEVVLKLLDLPAPW